MVLTVTKRADKVMFRPVEDSGKKSILVSGERQYTLKECSKWVNHGKFQDLQAASQRTQNLKYFGEAEQLEFESRGLAENTLDLEFESLWVIIRNGMAMQEREVPENVTVQTQESEDDTHRYKSVEATVAGHFLSLAHSNNNTSRTSAWSISTTTPSPTSLKTELYSENHHEEACLFFLADTRLPWSLR